MNPETISPSEARVLGVLIEKALTTPAQYPLTLNALKSGCNQKSNRHPVLDMSEDDVLDAIESLQRNGYTRTVFLEGSRVPKYRHIAREKLGVDLREIAVLAELMLRGPQTVGEIRGRASRMHKLESLDVVTNVLKSLAEREAAALVKRVPPLPGSRAERWAQLLAPDAHDVETESSAQPAARATRADGVLNDQIEELASRVDRIAAELESLGQTVSRLTEALGETDAQPSS